MPDWVLGGGTALMLHTGHRLSKDIDAFVADPQYLTIMSPRLSGEREWGCEAFAESTNHLKLIYSDGEIDFIVASAITGLPIERRSVELDDNQTVSIEIEHPVEIALKKLFYRGGLLKVRDIFDIAVVNSRHSLLLRDNLHCITHFKSAILARLSSISEEFCREELEELDIAEKWRPARRHVSGASQRNHGIDSMMNESLNQGRNP